MRDRFPTSLVSHVLATLLLALPAAAASQTSESRPPAPAAPEPTLEELAEEVTRAVVLIDVRTSSGSRQGSGFIVDPDGVILTNHHVLRDATGARVKLASGDVYDRVSILASDERRDIAIIRIDGFALPTLPLGNSDSVRIGSPVVVVGSPLGLENTVSTGIVSGRRQEPEGFQLLQVTAPASKGSSGGAVLTSRGKVVAIAASQLLAGQNLNFAVPINYARGMLQQVRSADEVVLEPMSGGVREEEEERAETGSEAANGGMSFDLGGLGGYVVESSAGSEEGDLVKTRVSYRRIETLGSARPRIEYYMESETTRNTEPFGTRQTVRRTRVRALMAADDLRPISSEGEVAWWTESGWTRAEHDLRFADDRVVGTVSDTAGRSVELDRAMPEGILLRTVLDFAFATLAADSLMGRSVEFRALDPWTGEIANDRYDVLGTERTDVAGPPRTVLRVNVASGLSNETILTEIERPRVAVVRRMPGRSGEEIATRVNVSISN